MIVAVVGSLNADHLIEVPNLPHPGETVVALGSRVSDGGKGANQAYYAAVTAPDGVTVHMIGRVGADADGRRMVDALAEVGVDVSGVGVAAGAASGSATILVDASGENNIVVVPGANAQWEGAGVELPPGCRVVVLQGEIPFAVAESAVIEARRLDARVVLNPAPFDARLVTLVTDGDVVVLNESEAADAFGLGSEISLEQLATVRAAARVVVTLGERGAALCGGGEVESLPAFPVDVVDTVGAGDSFVGALAGALANGAELRAALLRGLASASLAVASSGARAPLVRERLDELVRES